MVRKRIAAFLIDLFAACIIYAIVMIMFMILFRQSGKFSMKELDIIQLFYLLLFTLKDALGLSLGKRIMNLQIVNQNGEKADWRACFLRNLTLIIWPIEAIVLIASEKRIGDIIAKTTVIEVKNKS